MKKIAYVLASLLSLSLLGACQPIKSTPKLHQSATPSPSLSHLFNQRWQLADSPSSSLSLPKQTFVGFYPASQGLIHMSAGVGCNQQSLLIKIDRQQIIPQGQMTSTLMSCGELDQDERVLVSFLDNISHYQLKNNTLMLSDKAGKTLTFYAVGLDGDWQVVDTNGFDVMPTQTVQLSLKDGKASAYAGCNRLSFGYQAQDEQKLAIGGVASTRMACMDVPFEQALVQFLPNVVRYVWQGEQLALVDKDGKRLVLSPTPKSD